MKRFGALLIGASLAAFAPPAPAAFRPAAAVPAAPTAREAAFDAAISAADQMAWLKDFSSAPNHVGSAHDKANAEATLAQFRAWGWDAHIETFRVLYPTPLSTTLELVAPTRVRLGGQETPVPGDPSSAALAGALPPYVAYQGDGDVTAPVVYVNYGMPADYEALARRGIDVRGKIVLARYGAGWRGLKPKLAQEHGAVGCLIYSDPADDGYARYDSYPRGGGRPPQGVQRGSVQDMTLYPGDPLTPGIGATDTAQRLTRETAPTILKIPALPISYADATQILQGLQGPLATGGARGALGLAYHYGGTDAVRVHLAVRSDWSLKTLYDVIATLKGATLPDQWVLRANHRDAWVFGASDPLSGHVAMMSEAKALGQLWKGGWRPQRTIVYASWDGEEPGLLGSTEWAETHADELSRKAVLYVGTDNNGRGVLDISGSHDFQHFANQVAADVRDPETGATLIERQRADVIARDADRREGGGNEADLAAARAGGDMPIGALGSGSDYSAFLQHLGIPALDIGFHGEDATSGSYHSVYDSYHHYTTFDDPGLRYGVALAQVTGRTVMRAADAPLLPQRFTDFADTVGRYLDELKTLAAQRRAREDVIGKAFALSAFRLASNPDAPVAAPDPVTPTPTIDFAPLERATARLRTAAAAADRAVAGAATMTPAQQAKLGTALDHVDALLIDPRGLPFRPWYKNLIYAPGRFTGYGAKTLPGVREAIEERRFDDARTYVDRTAAVIDAYAARLESAARGSR